MREDAATSAKALHKSRLDIVEADIRAGGRVTASTVTGKYASPEGSIQLPPISRGFIQSTDLDSRITKTGSGGLLEQIGSAQAARHTEGGKPESD